MNFRMGLLDGSGIPKLSHRCGTQRSIDGVGQVFFVRLGDQGGQGLESFLGPDVAAGDGRLHAHEAVFIVSRGSEQAVPVLCQTVPVPELPGGCGSGVVVIALEKLAEQVEVGLLDVPVRPHRLDLVMPKAWVGGVEGLDPPVEGFAYLGGIHFPQFPLGPIAVSVFTPFKNIKQVIQAGIRDLGCLYGLCAFGENPPDSPGFAVSALIS